uniref:Uncharacterized protein n=1 Tax=viral metagenome TaxID=1070528 RepID=A0A6C0JY21_9ZZZZ
MHKIQSIVDSNSAELVNIIFGDLLNPQVVFRTPGFTRDNISDMKSLTKLILEISSRKLYYYGDIPINYYCAGFDKNLVPKYNLVFKELTDQELYDDLFKIKILSEYIFNKKIKIYIIPHLNLKLKATNNYIEKRNHTSNLLMTSCYKLGLNFCNIGKFLEHVRPETAFLEHYMEDHTHYSNDYNLVSSFIDFSVSNG